jgi:hypothetical protein
MLQMRLFKLVAMSVLVSASAMCSILPAYSSSRTNNVNAHGQSNFKDRANKIAVVVSRQNNFVYDFLGCKRGYWTDSIDCTFKITYIGNDASPHLQITSARIFSATDGNQYNSTGNAVAGQYSVNMIRYQPVRAVVSFPYPRGTKISTLEMETNHTNFPIRIGRRR